MTDDHSAKKAARARMAATGEPYSSARRAVQARPGHPAPLARLPAIDPREHAVHSRRWGLQVCYLVHYEGRYSVWFSSADPSDPSEAYPVPSEVAGRTFADAWQAMNLLRTPWDEQIAAIFLLSRDTASGILYEAGVVKVEDSGIWLACFDDTANDGGTHTLRHYESLSEALGQFAALADQAAGRLASEQAVGETDLLAGVLRGRAAMIRAEIARAALGDVIRRRRLGADDRNRLRPLWRQAGLRSESLDRVLAGQDWTWPAQPVVRPPGGRLPESPTTVLATFTVDGESVELVSYLDTAGARCLGIDRDGRRDLYTWDIEVSQQHLANAATAAAGQDMMVIYGRVHDSVTELYAIMKDGERVDWPIYDDPRSAERYFAVIADREALADIVAAAPTGSTSLKYTFAPPTRPGVKRHRARSR